MLLQYVVNRLSSTYSGVDTLSRNTVTCMQSLPFYSTYEYRVRQYNPSRNGHHKLKRNCSVIKLAQLLRTYIYVWFSTHIFFISQWRRPGGHRVNHKQIWGLIRTKPIFQYFTGPGNFRKKCPWLSRRHGNHDTDTCHTRYYTKV